MATKYKTSRRLKRYWRTPGNPRLKGLFLAGLDHTDVRSNEVGEVWPMKTDERERLLQANPSHPAVKAPLAQQYSPGWHGDVEQRPESAFARELARDEFGDNPGDADTDAGRFMRGEKTVSKDQYVQRALLNDAVTELDVLFREELETTFIMGAQPRKIFRDASDVVNVNRRKGDIPRETDETYANVGGEIDETRTGQEGQDTVAFTTERIHQGFEISDALMAESEPDIFESLARRTGAAVENTLNRIALVDLIDNAGNTVDADVASNTLTAVQALNHGIATTETNDFPTPNQAVVHPEFEQELFDDTNVVYANRGGSTEPLQDRQVGTIMGLERWKASDGAYNNATNTKTIGSVDHTFGYAADNERGAVVYPQEMHKVVIWEDFDMETKDYEDPIRDLQGRNVRTWMDAVTAQTNAITEIHY